MSEYRSPYLVTRHEIYVHTDQDDCARSLNAYFDTDEHTFKVLDEAALQKRAVLRAARLKPSSRWGLLWGFAINAVLWGLFGCLIYWIGQLGFWDWIRGWF